MTTNKTEQLISTIRKSAFSAAVKNGARIDDAEDIAQDVVIRLMEKIEGGLQVRNLKGLAAVTAKRILIDNSRKDCRLCQLSDEIMGKFEHATPVYNPEVLEDLGVDNIDDSLILLLLTDGFDYKEIAGTLDITPLAVKSRVLRLRKNLQPEVKQWIWQ